MGTREQVPQLKLSNNESRAKNFKSCTKCKYITRKHGYGHDGFKSLAMKDTVNLQMCLSY